jgi:Protein of unknown function (DUF1580)
MQTEPQRDQLVPLSEAARKFLPGRNGKPVSPTTLWRWSQKGVKAPDGSRIKLEVWHCGNSTYTTEKACADFIERQTLARQPLPVPDWPRRSDETNRKLLDAGLL